MPLRRRAGPGRRLRRRGDRAGSAALADGGPRAVVGALAVAVVAAAACGPGGPEADARDVARLTLLGTTDVHGHLLPRDEPRGGGRDASLAGLASLVDSIRAVHSAVLLFDSGDLLQGTPLNAYQAEVRLDSVHPVIAAMNALGYDAAAIGNHEFNYGLPFLQRALEPARFPFLAGNVHLAGTDSTPWSPYALLRAGGVRVGVVGLVTPGVAIWDRAHVEGRLRFEDLVASARRWVPRVREAGAEVVVVLAHSGMGPGSSYGPEAGVPEENAVGRLAREVPGIDVIFAGHSHRRVAERIDGTLVVQAGEHAGALAVAHVRVSRAPSGRREVATRGEVLSTAGWPAAPRVVAAARDAHRRTEAWLDEPIGWTPDRWSAAGGRFRDTPLADLVTTVERTASGAGLASTAVFDTAVAFGPGPMTRRDVLSVYVYPNTLRSVRLSGAELRAYLERSARYFRTWPSDALVADSVPGYDFDVVSGVDYALDLARPVGRRVVELRHPDGRPVAASDSFTLALNNYRQSGGGGYDMVADAPVVHRGARPLSDLIVDFVRARDTIRHEDVFRRNWSLRPEAAVERLLGSGGAEPR